MIRVIVVFCRACQIIKIGSSTFGWLPKNAPSRKRIMESILVALFVAGYAAIVFEHNIRLNKTASALFTGVLLWTLYALGLGQHEATHQSLGEHFLGIAEILFFLLGAMTVVELVDAHDGFSFITDRITTRNVRTLLWIVSIATFFLSAALDNLTTAIVMMSLLRKLVRDVERRKVFAGMVIIAANAGGAWSPIGDVTTTMLWIGGQITALNIVVGVFLPSVVCMLIPLAGLSWRMSGELEPVAPKHHQEKPSGSLLMFILGVGGLVFVPVFKSVTHLPPYMGMLFVLSLIWIASEVVHRGKDEEIRRPYTASEALKRTDTPSILFFLGILLAIGVLEVSGLLHHVALWLNQTVGNLDLITITIGLLSAVVDNVPLVAASMGMYDLATYPQDHKLWESMAYAAGTGGSILIIGSAAGVAVMGMEKIDFMWYARKIGLWAALGYFAGAGVYLIQYALLHG